MEFNSLYNIEILRKRLGINSISFDKIEYNFLTSKSKEKEIYNLLDSTILDHLLPIIPNKIFKGKDIYFLSITKSNMPSFYLISTTDKGKYFCSKQDFNLSNIKEGFPLYFDADNKILFILYENTLKIFNLENNESKNLSLKEKDEIKIPPNSFKAISIYKYGNFIYIPSEYNYNNLRSTIVLIYDLKTKKWQQEEFNIEAGQIYFNKNTIAISNIVNTSYLILSIKEDGGLKNIGTIEEKVSTSGNFLISDNNNYNYFTTLNLETNELKIYKIDTESNKIELTKNVFLKN
jgi:hypothetical protein